MKFLLFCLLIAGCFGGSASAQVLGERKVFGGGKYSIRPPDGWKIADKEDGGFSADATEKSAKGTNIIAGIVESDVASLEEGVFASIKKQHPELRKLDEEPWTSQAGLKGQKVLVEFRNQAKVRVRVTWYMLVPASGMVVYFICSTPYDMEKQSAPLFDDAVNSLRLEGAK